ncbi:MAG TPA: pyruvate dehydrogenase complex dihydrolipoamide acetyltransferase [Xanthobacteraceae bacterium]|nr:pyruvate dehydrogenase complex dihydrolipoamide acetyltransferase [Xanthobacteraceae bacterium]
MDVLMPQLGETVAEGKITKWFKSAGDEVKPGDNLFEIETDKVSMEVPSTTNGVLAEIRVPAGAVAPVGAVVGVIADDAGATASAAATATASGPPPQSADRGSRRDAPAAAADNDERPRAALDPFFEVRTPQRNYGPARLPGGATVTPLARRLAGEAGIDLSQLQGSGPRGRILARDIAAVPHTVATAPAVSAAGPSAAEIMALFEPGSYQEVPLDGMRRTIAVRLTQAAQTIPHFYLTTDADIGRLIALREEANNAAPKDRDGNAAFKLSVNDFIIRALALGLQKVPAANAVWAGDRILRFAHSDIGVAVALEGGLITPVIRHADTKSLSAISAEMKDLVTRARAKKLKPAEYQGGAAAISNLGMHGVREFSAIINPPHATILAVGAARRQAIVTDDGGVAFASMLSLTLSCDHRVVDGALGAELLATIKRLIESPVTMLV